jgi:putative ABC transport system permease protein
MFRNYLASALGNLARNRLYAAISIFGLAVAFAAAVLIAQFVRNEFSYDHWLPGYQQVYKITDGLVQPGQPAGPDADVTQAAIAGQLKTVMPDVIAARLMEDVLTVRRGPGDKGVAERDLGWTDPDFFKVFPLPALAGDLSTALRQPDSVVITRSVARKYFHRDLPVGDTLQVQTIDQPPGNPLAPGVPTWHTLRVTAVLKDLPSNTNLTTEIFASGKAAYSELAKFETHSSLGNIGTYTFVRLPPKRSAADLQRALDVAGRPEMALFEAYIPGSRAFFHAVPIGDAHLTPVGLTSATVKPVGSKDVAYGTAGVGALIVLVAAINFVTLMTARAGRRGVEVGVRKASGARRGDLMAQFMGEALVQVAIAVVLAVVLSELLIRPFSAFMQRELSLNLITDPLLLPGILGAALVIGLIASAYPALVLSSFRPAAVLKGGVIQTTGSAIGRQALVVMQFAILVGLIVTTATIYRQTTFALNRGLGGADSKFIAGIMIPSCDTAFPEEVRRLPGVSAVACSSMNALNTPNAKNIMAVKLASGRKASFDVAPVDFGFFELYGVHPLAGRLFQSDRGEDRALEHPENRAQPTVIINETAARDLGFSDPKSAIGGQLTWTRGLGLAANATQMTAPSQIIGVVPDVPMTVRVAADPTFYFVVPKKLSALSIRFTGEDIPGTVRGIEQVWKRTGHTDPFQLTYLSQYRLTQYLDIVIQGVTIAICALLAVLIACLGLFALAAYTTERRTKEIGIRKVMGASTLDVVKLLVWQFTIPVLWAIVVAVPIGVWGMSAWLSHFVYHVQLSPWSFVLAAVAAVVIAWATVTWQSYLVARAQPAGALRYE